MNSSKDKHEPPNLEGAMESQTLHCSIRSSLFTSFFDAPTFISSTVAFSFVIFSFRAVTLAARTCPRWVTGSRTVPSSSDATKLPEADSDSSKRASAPSTGLRKLMPPLVHPVGEQGAEVVADRARRQLQQGRDHHLPNGVLQRGEVRADAWGGLTA